MTMPPFAVLLVAVAMAVVVAGPAAGQSPTPIASPSPAASPMVCPSSTISPSPSPSVSSEPTSAAGASPSPPPVRSPAPRPSPDPCALEPSDALTGLTWIVTRTSSAHSGPRLVDLIAWRHGFLATGFDAHGFLGIWRSSDGRTWKGTRIPGFGRQHPSPTQGIRNDTVGLAPTRSGAVLAGTD